MTAPLVVLGATGSIGTQTLDVADRLGLEVAVLAARNPSQALADLARAHPDAAVVVAGGSADERSTFEESVGKRVEYGSEAVEAAAGEGGRIVVNGIVGSAGLRSTIAALRSGNRVALANKESMVAGGPLVVEALRDGGGELIPVDSEHSAIYQCLSGEASDSVARLLLTASGGPFRNKPRDELAQVTPEQALNHPTWNMGARITIDSATMFNKGLEVIEAHFLFALPYDQIDVVVHPQSIVHSMVEFVDGSLKAHLGDADMRIPIQYAITFPERRLKAGDRFDIFALDLTFEPPDELKFPALRIAREAGVRGGTAPAVLNAADEIAVAAFLQGRLGFMGISDVVERTLTEMDIEDVESVDHVIEVDAMARSVAAGFIASVC